MNAVKKLTISRIIWDEWNVAHIAKHQVIPNEVEEVLHSKFIIEPTYRERLSIIGPTKLNRMLTIVVHEDQKDVYYVITARDAEEKELQAYYEERGE